MGMMTRMRDNAHVFIIAFAVVFIAFWVISDVDLGAVMRDSATVVGKIEGKTISYQEFQAAVERAAEQRRKENQGRDLTEDDYSQIREQIWGDYVTQAVIERAVKQFGISVTDDEITDWVNSSTPPQVLAQYFVDSTGQFNRDAYQQFLRNPGKENQQALLQVEDQLRSELVRTKLTTILSSSITVSDLDLRNKFVEQNADFNASYILFEPAVYAAKDTAAPTDAEFESFYEKYKKRFKTEEMRKLRVVMFPEVPSAADTASVRNELASFMEQVAKGTDFLTMVKDNSEKKFDDRFVTRDQVPPEVADRVFDQPVGAMVGPVPNETGLSIYRIIAEQQGANTLTHAAHILFRTDAGQNEASQKVLAEKAFARAKAGEDFGMLAATLSQEPGAAQRKGDLGWFGKGRMVKEFEDPVLAAKTGQILGPIKTQFGWHVIKVLGRSSRELKLAELSLTIRASAGTRDEVFERARDFAYLASEEGFEKQAKFEKASISETPEFAKQSGSYIPNVGMNPALMKFAFDGSVGDVSEVHRASNGYVVAMISSALPAGYRPLESVKEQIKSQVVFERQLEQTLAAAKRISTGKNLEQISAAQPNLQIVTPPVFKISSGLPNIGPDQAFIGTLLSLKKGQTSTAFRGMRGVFVVRLNDRTPFNEASFKLGKDQLLRQESQARQQEFVQSWLEQQKEQLSITDNRDKFFR
jgi:peptidyl-prolyl cis-trans isomerase D